MHRSDDNPFKIAGGNHVQPVRGQPETGLGSDSASSITRVAHLVGSADVFLFIKGTPKQPMCGFSANTVAVMDSMGVRYRTFDVLSDEGVRAAAKQYADWPTFPQVYVRGAFVGGDDIITEMAGTGELNELLTGVGS